MSSDITNTTKNRGTFIDDRDGHVYKWVRIGNQRWMAENLAYMPHVSPPGEREGTVYSSGYGIWSGVSYVTPPNEPGQIAGIWVYRYNGNNDNVAEAKCTVEYKTYGCLYDWGTAFKVVPKGWHLPTDEEWLILSDYLGDSDIAGGKLKEVGTSHWRNPNTNATNEVGFSGLPGGAGIFGVASPKVANMAIG
ncbi:MAG: FISUMP domain-containing protein [Bryobacteraceae bacterium]|jgi:hypothetical protein